MRKRSRRDIDFYQDNKGEINLKCKMKENSNKDCLLENIPDAILCTRPKIRSYVKDKLLNGYVLMTGDINCMDKFQFRMNPNWEEDFKYIQPICAMTKYGMRYFFIVENDNKMRDIFFTYYKQYYDVDELNNMIYCNFHESIPGRLVTGCVTEIIEVNPDFKGNLQEEIDKLLDQLFTND